jgi:hypothetical protein
MRRRKLLVALAGLAVVSAVGSSLFVVGPRANRITKENFDHIRGGLSRSEVEAILGPAGDYRTGPTYPRLAVSYGSFGGNTTGWVEWTADGTLVEIVFDDAGRVGVHGYEKLSRRPKRPIGDLLWRVQRQWHRWFPE